MRPDPPHRLRLYPIMSFAEGRLQVSHKFERTFSEVYEGALPPVETDDSLNAGWDGPPSWNVSAAAMTGDIVL